MMKFSLSDENKSLRLKLNDEQEKFNQLKKKLTDKIFDLENQVSDLEFLNAEQSINLKVLEEELINKNCGEDKSGTASGKNLGDRRKGGQSCFALHTASISGINDYISLLAKAKDDVVNYKKKSAHLHSELEQYKNKLSAKNIELEKLKVELENANKFVSSSTKRCTCHEVDSNYESLDDSKSDSQYEDQRNCFSQRKVCKSKSSCVECNSKPAEQGKGILKEKKKSSDIAVQASDLEKIVGNRLDEYIRKAKDIIPDEISNESALIKKIQDERDYYCREYHRLKDKILHASRTLEHHHSLECPFRILDSIRSKLIDQSMELEELKKMVIERKQTTNHYNSSNHNLEDRLKRLERKESELSVLNEKLASKVRKMEDQCHEYREKIHSLTKEKNQQKTVYSQIRMMQDDSERSLFNAQNALRKCDSELNCALSKINQLEDDNKKLKDEFRIVGDEKKCLKKHLVQLDHEKDCIGIKLDEKTEMVVRLEQELRDKKKHISDLQHKVNKLEESMKILQNINMKTEETARYANKNYSSMQHELTELQKNKEALIIENRRLQDNLSAAVKDCFQSNSELQCAKAEVEELKIRLQSYVSEVRRIEDILQIKEDERRFMLEQLKGINGEYSSNNSKRTLETSGNLPYGSSSDFTERYRDLGNEYLEQR